MAIKTPQLSLKSDFAQNVVINGNFDLWQRGTSSLAASASAYLADRFKVLIEGGVVQANIRQSTDVPTVAQSGFKSTNSLEVEISTAEASPGASAFLAVQYNLEGYDYAPLAGKKSTLSFWIKASVTGTYSLSLLNSASTTSYVTEFTIDAANTWEKKSITFANDGTTVNPADWDLTNGAGLRMHIALMSGATAKTSTLGSWESASARASTNQANLASLTSNVMRLAQVQLVDGLDSPTFRRCGKNFKEELSLCQRYYISSKAYKEAYATAGNQRHQSYFAYPTTMRANPTVSDNVTSSANIRAPASTFANVNLVDNYGAAVSIESAAAGQFSAEVEYTANAEL